MSHKAVIFFLAVGMIVLFLIVLYQQYVFRRGTRKKLREINEKLREIIETDSREQVMVFTEDQELMELAAHKCVTGKAGRRKGGLPPDGACF